MALGIEAYLNTGYGQTTGASSVFDYSSANKTARQQADSLLSLYNSNKEQVQTLKTDTASYLDKYSVSMKELGQAADKVRLGNLNKLLHDKDGNVTDKTVEDTVKAVGSMVESYNNTLKLLNDNADRGPGTLKQLGRMAADPAPEASMKMLGVTVNKDGTLNLDTEKLTEALKTENPAQLNLMKDLLGGFGGLADGVHKDASYGSNMSARELVRNDLASIQATRQENPFTELYTSLGSNVYALNNQAVTGMLMNFLI